MGGGGDVTSSMVQRNQPTRSPGWRASSDMFGWGMSTCIFCDRRVSSKEVLPLRDWKNVAICTACYAGWEKNGKKCGACGTVVHGMPEVSAFEKPKRTFGHADCGGMRIGR